MTYRLIAATLLFALAARAQSPVGLLSLVSGDVKIVRAGQETPVAARTADLLAAGDRIVTGASGEATFLFCPQSKTAKAVAGSEIEFAAGSFAVRKGKLDGERAVPSCRLPATLTLAAASRVQVGKQNLRGDLLMRSPVNTNIATLRPRFQWEEMNRAKSYELKVRDREERILWRTEVTGTEVEYPADATPLAWGQKYWWRLTARDEREPLEEVEKPFQILAADQAQDVRLAEDSLRAMVEQSPDDNWPRFLLAFMYEERGLLDEAARLYYDLDQRMGSQPWVEGRLNDLLNKLGWDRVEK
jgi:hypothetical protein